MSRKDWNWKVVALLMSTVAPIMPAGAQVGGDQSAAPYEARPSSETSDGVKVEDIVVTAQRRAQSVQSVPMSITALGEERLIQSGITQLADYAVQVPNLTFARTGFLAATGQRITIRGIFGPNTTALYLDETPLPGTIDPRALDLNRIEVLRGPQGSLYGARSMGGAIRFITNQPSDSDIAGFLHAAGSTTRYGGLNGSADGAINLPIADGAAIRASGFVDSQSGFIKRVPSALAPVQFAPRDGVGRSFQYGASLAGSVSADDDRFTLMPRVLYQRSRTYEHQYTDVTPDDLTVSRLFDIKEPGYDELQLYSLTAKYDAGFGELTGNVSRFVRDSRDTEDDSELASVLFGVPPTPFVFVTKAVERTTSAEVRFVSALDGPFQFTVGGFFQNSFNRILQPPTPLTGVTDNIFDEDFKTRTKEYAAFGELTLDLTSKLRIIAGGRYYRNTVNFVGTEGGLTIGPLLTITGVQKENGINPRLGIQYRMTPDHMIYANAARGFRAGGVNVVPVNFCEADLATLGLTPEQVQSYSSDTVWSYEAGVKTSWLDRRLVVNGALFDIEWSDVQQTSVLPQCGFGFRTNTGKARSRGAELEVQAALGGGTHLSFGAGFTDAKITDPGPLAIIPKGRPIQQVPKWTLSGSLDHRQQIGSLPVFVHAEVSYVGSSVSTNNSVQNPRIRGAYTLARLRAGVEFDRLTAALFVDNLTDERANLSDVVPQAAEVPGRPRIAVNQPRTIGIDLRWRFGSQ